MSEKKKSKKGIIIFIIIILICALAVGITAFVMTRDDEQTSKKEDKTVGTEWGDSYYLYLADNIDNEVKEALQEGEELNNIELSFIDINEENPVMLMEINSKETAYVKVCYIAKDKVETTDYVSSDNDFKSVDYLYNIENKSYDWYISLTDSETKTESYTTLGNYIADSEENYEFSMENTYSDDPYNVSEYDKTFVKIENVELPKMEITDEKISDNDIFKEVTNTVNEYKKAEDLITEDVEKQVEEGLKTLENLNAEAKAAKEKQAAEEEARKKAEEEKKAKGIQVGNYTLKYGTYKGTDAQYSEEGVESYEVTITLNTDNTYTLTSTNQEIMPNSSGTFTVRKFLWIRRSTIIWRRSLCCLSK